MPRVVFRSLKEASGFFDNWVHEVRGDAYVGYYAQADRQLVLVPKVSTDPIIYGLIDNVQKADLDEWIKQRPDFVIIPVVRLDWDSRQEP